jgi:hypothetical protein
MGKDGRFASVSLQPASFARDLFQAARQRLTQLRGVASTSAPLDNTFPEAKLKLPTGGFVQKTFLFVFSFPSFALSSENHEGDNPQLFDA